MALANVKYSFEIILLAAILDGINWRNWSVTKDANSGVNRPKSMVNRMLGIQEKDSSKNSDKTIIFDSGEAFEKMRSKLLKGEI